MHLIEVTSSNKITVSTLCIYPFLKIPEQTFANISLSIGFISPPICIRKGAPESLCSDVMQHQSEGLVENDHAITPRIHLQMETFREAQRTIVICFQLADDKNENPLINGGLAVNCSSDVLHRLERHFHVLLCDGLLPHECVILMLKNGDVTIEILQILRCPVCIKEVVEMLRELLGGRLSCCKICHCCRGCY